MLMGIYNYLMSGKASTETFGDSREAIGNVVNKFLIRQIVSVRRA